jgi:tetratricopeptide (TPR) repeat protein
MVKTRFENLTSILSVLFVVAIASLVKDLPGFSSSATLTPGYQVQGYQIPGRVSSPPSMGQAQEPPAPREPMSERERRVNERFQQAVALLHAKRYDYAITALDAVLAEAPDMPEAYVNMGYAFLGMEEYGPAQGAFETAINLRLDQANAYYGLAMAFEGQKDYEGALGAMRSFIHLSPPDSPFVTKARAALWEWEGELGRLPGIQPAPEGAEPEVTEGAKWSDGHGHGGDQ